jgi:hypothetical protein
MNTCQKQRKIEQRYKKLSFVFFVLLLILLFQPAQAAECLRYSGTGNNTAGEYDVYYRDGDPIDGCTLTVVMHSSEYAVLKTKAEDIVIDSTQFDMTLSTILVIACCLAWCLGFLAHEMGAK